MTQEQFYNALTEEQKRLFNHLSDYGYSVYFIDQKGEICAEIGSCTDGGVDVVINLIPFNIDNLQNWFVNFDIDGTIEKHRQDKIYRNAFRISQSVHDFEAWYDNLRNVICRFINSANE